MAMNEGGDPVASDAAFQLWLDSRDPEQVLADRSAGLVGEEAIMYEAARRRADSRNRRRAALAADLEARHEQDPRANITK